MSNGQLWVLFHAGLPHVGAPVSLILRMIGSGSLRLVAVGPAGRRLAPEQMHRHYGSTWQRPGDEWDATFLFPTAGCWDLQATRQTGTGFLRLDVQP